MRSSVPQYVCRFTEVVNSHLFFFKYSTFTVPYWIVVWNIKSQQARLVKLTPSDAWGGAGLLGVTIRFDNYAGAEDRLVRILTVEPQSPAAVAGLVPEKDFLLGTTHQTLDSTTQLAAVLRENQDQVVELYVYNTDSDMVRVVALMPTLAWGGGGLLGAEVGTGYLHRLPSKSRHTEGSSVQRKVRYVGMGPPKKPGQPAALEVEPQLELEPALEMEPSENDSDDEVEEVYHQRENKRKEAVEPAPAIETQKKDPVAESALVQPVESEPAAPVRVEPAKGKPVEGDPSITTEESQHMNVPAPVPESVTSEPLTTVDQETSAETSLGDTPSSVPAETLPAETTPAETSAEAPAMAAPVEEAATAKEAKPAAKISSFMPPPPKMHYESPPKKR